MTTSERLLLNIGVAAILCGLFVALMWMVPARAAERVCGTASWYQYGTITRSGEAFHPDGHTAAMVGTKHLGEVYRVHYGHKSVVVRINDTGGFAKYGRIIDLSRGAAAAIGLIGRGVGTVCLERLR